MTQIPKFTLGNKEFTVKIDFNQARTVIPERFKFHILQLFADEAETEKQMMKLLLDDQYALDLMEYFVTESGEEWATYVRYVKDMADVDLFREAFWAGVVNFSSSLKKDLLLKAWKTMKKELKKVLIENDDS